MECRGQQWYLSPQQLHSPSLWTGDHKDTPQCIQLHKLTPDQEGFRHLLAPAELMSSAVSWVLSLM